MIAVRLINKELFSSISIGNEVIIQGTRERKVDDDKRDSRYGQTCIMDAEIVLNNKGNHKYSDAKFVTGKTVKDFYDLDAKVDYSTTVFILTGTIKFPSGNGQVSINDANGNSVGFYSSGSNQYSFLKQFEGQEVTVEVAACNWNNKTYWRGCVLAVRLADGSKILNELNFTTN